MDGLTFVNIAIIYTIGFVIALILDFIISYLAKKNT